MFNLIVGHLLVRKKEAIGDPDLDSLIGTVLYIRQITETEVQADVAYPKEKLGQVVLTNEPTLLEELFDTQPLSLIDQPATLGMDANDWFLLCMLFQRYSPADMKWAMDTIVAGINERRGNILLSIVLPAPPDS